MESIQTILTWILGHLMVGLLLALLAVVLVRLAWSAIGIWKVLVTLLILCALAIGAAFAPPDRARLEHFARTAHEWQQNPDYRKVTTQYVVESNEAMQARPLGFTATHVIMFIRRLPYMPPSLAVNDTSQKHYDDFTNGELSAYLHLCTEQKPENYIYAVESRGKDLAAQTPAEQQKSAEDFLTKSFQLDPPVVTDDGAKAGVIAFLRDAHLDRPLRIPRGVIDELREQGVAIARAKGYPAEISQMTREQQHTVFSELDGSLRAFEPQWLEWTSLQRLIEAGKTHLPVDLGSLSPATREMVAQEAVKLQHPGSLEALTTEQRLAAVDAAAKRLEPEAMKFEVWRTKQLTDLASGVWGQSFGAIYAWAITKGFEISDVCRTAAIITMGAWIIFLVILEVRRRRKKRLVLARAAAGAAAGDGPGPSKEAQAAGERPALPQEAPVRGATSASE